MQDNLQLNIPDMDKIHDEFLDLLSKIKSCNKRDFLPLFEEMITHTKEHFAYEERIMTEHDFYGKQEHCDEHTNLLNEMQYFYEKAQRIPAFGRSYINDYAYEKFKRHVISIDSQLAMFLKEHNLSS
ncbi:hemerythrin domain-containing protein [Sulfurovum mangrovi]|uniref:hemerythrin domain-containing protein n=1 Tax=Sulfurovum mangrovi TaxID=2893889 RepID=UPI001E4B934B|nr:hemerythrin domain-containing protein [Sulfurovum mangrovi]UFH58389.1 hemerythrin [Sulfurovum mangrovi]